MAAAVQTVTVELEVVFYAADMNKNLCRIRIECLDGIERIATLFTKNIQTSTHFKVEIPVRCRSIELYIDGKEEVPNYLFMPFPKIASLHLKDMKNNRVSLEENSSNRPMYERNIVVKQTE